MFVTNKNIMNKIYALLILILFTNLSFSQTDNGIVNRTNALKIFLECTSCDFEYIKQELTYVNYVRDPKEAQVHILVSSQITGSGGTEYKLYFSGQQELKGMTDTLFFSTNANNTNDETRAAFLQILQAGLIRYVAKTSVIKDISFKYNAPSKNEVVKDKWDNWVFDLSSSAWLNAQQTYHSTSINSSLNIDRVTENWKYNFYVGHNYNEQKYEMTDGSIFSFNKSLYSSTELIKSISKHWSAGANIGAQFSTYNNIKLGYFAFPAIEYNIFPYSESSRKQLTLRYNIGYKHLDYIDTTIYNKTHENLFTESLNIGFKTIQKWGSINISVSGQNYMHDFTKNSLNTSFTADIRIVKGLSFNIYGYYSFVRNQLSLPKAGATQEEILLRQRELQTNYTYYCSIGLTYTFGSIYNNVVNPRFSL